MIQNNKYLVPALIMSSLVGITLPIAALAATSPSLGSAASYGVLGSTYTNTSPTTITGDVGFTTGPAVAPLGVHPHYGSGAPYAAAGTDQGAALSALNSQACTFIFAPGAVDLSTDTTHGTAGTYAPGVYCGTAAMNVDGPLSLTGSGTYIFRSVGALTTTASASVTMSGASACDVFWTPGAATTLGANTNFGGTVISNAGITVGSNTTWTGRALAFGGTVTTDTDTITAPNCSSPPPPAPVCTLSVNPASVTLGANSTLAWTTTNATGFSIDHSIGALSPLASGSTSVSPVATITYTGTVVGAGGSSTCSATVTVTAALAVVPPVVVPTPTPILVPVQTPLPGGSTLTPSATTSVGSSQLAPSTPTMPATGAGGNASATILTLLVSAMLAFAGFIYLRYRLR